MGGRGRESLRQIKINHFEVAPDPLGRRYIHQIVKEHDKNHKENDLESNNQARVYEIPGKYI